MKKQATLKDIARRSNVSIATVSRVINGVGMKAARPEVQDRIWQAVKELDYVPNTAAQMLKKQDAPKILKTVACLYTRSSNFQNDPFFSEIARAIETELLQRGCLMKFSTSIQNYPQKTIENFLSNEKVDGVIVLGRTEKKYIDLIKRYNRNVVCVGLNRSSIEANQVICDGFEAATLALNHLSEMGADKEIFYLGETINEVRYKAFQKFMAEKGITAHLRQYVIETEFSSQKAYEKMQEVLMKGIVPHFLFCGNDLTAFGAIKAIQEANLTIPKDVEIVSIDNIELAQFSSPMLTTINVPTEQMGRLAAKLITEENEESGLPLTILLPPTLVKRGTTKKFL